MTMITLCIRYEIDHNKQREFEEYAAALTEPIRRCGGDLVGYFVPTRLAGRTNVALALINLPSLSAYEKYRENVEKDPGCIAAIAKAESVRCILSEDRAFVKRVHSQ